MLTLGHANAPVKETETATRDVINLDIVKMRM